MKTLDTQIAQIKHEIAPILKKAEEIAQVEGAESETRAVEFLSQVKRRFKLVDDARKFLVKPLNDHVKAINNEFKATLAPLNEAEIKVKTGITLWRDSDEFKAMEDKRLALEAEAREAVKAGSVEALEEIGKEHAEASKEAPKSVESESGKAHFREVLKFEIEDVNKVPREFLVPNEALIRKALNAGALIEGVKSWKEKTPVIR